MSMDRSLKSKDTLQRHRNVLDRAERIALLQETSRWTEGKATGLPKVAHRKASVGKKDKAEKKAEGEAAAPGAAGAAAGAPAAAPAAAAADKKGDKKAADKKADKKK